MTSPSNSELMDRYGFKICARCNADMPAKDFKGPLCKYCGADFECILPEEPAEINLGTVIRPDGSTENLDTGETTPPVESSYDRIKRGIEEHNDWKAERAREENS